MNYSKTIRRKQIAKRILASWAIIAAAFFVLGFIVGQIASYKPTDEQKTAQGTVERAETQIIVYGVYDGKEAEQKKIDWDVPDDFEPLDVAMDADLQEFVFCICKAYNLDFTFVMAMIENESSYQADVVSDTGDWGLMQINKGNFEMLTAATGVTDYLDPYQSIIAGCYVLKDLFEKYEEPNKVLMAYNMGEGGASKLWEKGVFVSDYSDKVLSIQAKMNQETEGSD